MIVANVHGIDSEVSGLIKHLEIKRKKEHLRSRVTRCGISSRRDCY